MNYFRKKHFIMFLPLFYSFQFLRKEMVVPNNFPCEIRNLKLILKKDVKEETEFNSQSTLYQEEEYDKKFKTSSETKNLELMELSSMSHNDFLFIETHCIILQIKNLVVPFLFLSLNCVSYISLININIYPLWQLLESMFNKFIALNFSMLIVNILF